MIVKLASVWRLTMAAGLLSVAGAGYGRTFISPMGEPFRTDPGDKLPEEIWFEGADKNGDGKITRAEFMADAGRFFKLLDVNHNGEIGPEEIERYEEDIAPEVGGGGFGEEVRSSDGGGKHKHGARNAGGSGGSGGMGGMSGGSERGRHGYGGDNDDAGQDESSGDDTPKPAYKSSNIGAARFSYLDIPEPIASADTDFNRGVSPSEFVAAANHRFDLLDANHDGVLTREELPHLSGSGGAFHGPHGDGSHGPPPPANKAPGAPGS